MLIQKKIMTQIPTRTIILFIIIVLSVHFLAMDIMAAEINGQVVLEKTGEPVQGVTVRAHHRPLETVSDKNGRFTFQELNRGIYTIVAHPVGYLPARYSVNISETDTIDIKIGLNPATVNSNKLPGLRIIVIGGPEAKPLYAATVELTGISKRSGRTNEKGFVLFNDLKPGFYSIKVKEPNIGKTVEVEKTLGPGGIIHDQIVRFFPDE